jgi:hypothetical protein
MGGKMNLNPLKSNDNTDALVKALEDANNVAGSDQTTPVTDGSVIAADPQVTSSGIVPGADVADAAQTDPVLPTEQMDTPGISTTPPATESTLQADADATAGAVFNDTDMPLGLSSDATAHLENEGTGDNSELDDVKRSALEQLRPLIEKIDLEPADKFDKYLMMLRASDDPALIKPAFDAAQGIEGEKEKAQALLDIINEINYITANQPQDQPQV